MEVIESEDILDPKNAVYGLGSDLLDLLKGNPPSTIETIDAAYSEVALKAFQYGQKMREQTGSKDVYIFVDAFVSKLALIIEQMNDSKPFLDLVALHLCEAMLEGCSSEGEGVEATAAFEDDVLKYINKMPTEHGRKIMRAFMGVKENFQATASTKTKASSEGKDCFTLFLKEGVNPQDIADKLEEKLDRFLFNPKKQSIDVFVEKDDEKHIAKYQKEIKNILGDDLKTMTAMSSTKGSMRSATSPHQTIANIARKFTKNAAVVASLVKGEFTNLEDAEESATSTKEPILLSKTYNTYCFDDEGDVIEKDSGYLFDHDDKYESVEELADYMKADGHYEFSSYPIRAPFNGWFILTEESKNLRTGERTSYAFHLENLSQDQWEELFTRLGNSVLDNPFKNKKVESNMKTRTHIYLPKPIGPVEIANLQTITKAKLRATTASTEDINYFLVKSFPLIKTDVTPISNRLNEQTANLGGEYFFKRNLAQGKLELYFAYDSKVATAAKKAERTKSPSTTLPVAQREEIAALVKSNGKMSLKQMKQDAPKAAVWMADAMTECKSGKCTVADLGRRLRLSVADLVKEVYGDAGVEHMKAM